MKIIFDLDYTLLDTKKLKNKLADIFNKENFYADHKKYFKDKGINFASEKYLAMLKGAGRLDARREKELKSGLKDLFANLDNYLFKDAARILSRLKAGRVELILITFGDKKWHEKKVKSLSIGRYFDKIIFEEKNKAESEYLKLLENTAEDILIVNDNAQETEKMAEIIGKNTKVFLIDGPYAKNIEHNWPIHELGELIV